MKRTILPLAAILLLAGCLGCDDWHSQLAANDAETRAKGWMYFETLGEPGEWAMDGWGESPTASSIGASWVVGGKKEKDEYYQTNYLYFVHSYIKLNGDEFVTVYRRDKPKVRITN